MRLAPTPIFLTLFYLLIVLVSGAVIQAPGSVDYPIGDSPFPCSLRGAIINANADSMVDKNCAAGDGFDTIILSTDFTITLDVRGENNGYSGDLDIKEALLIQPDNGRRTINGGGQDRIFDISGSNTVGLQLNGITLTNGHDNGFDSENTMAAAIRSVGGAYLQLNDITIETNALDLTEKFSAVTGTAGIYFDGPFEAQNVIFRSNRVFGNIPETSEVAGALLSKSPQNISVDNFELDSNVVEDFTAHHNTYATAGFGNYGSGQVDIKQFRAIHNRGQHGGVALVGSTAGRMFVHMIADLEGNSADEGGAFYYRSSNPLEIDMNGFNILSNGARLGGFLYGESGSVIIQHFGRIESNSATENGGVAFTSDFDLSFHFGNTITNNTAGNNGGLIWTSRGDVELESITSVTSNEAANEGGLIYVENQLLLGVRINNITNLHNNKATSFNSIGGAVSAHDSSVSVTNIQSISGHYAFQGGVIAHFSTTPGIYEITLSDVFSITNNTANHPEEAGAIIFSNGADVRMTHIHNEISGNAALNGEGGLILVIDADVEISESTADIFNNFAFNGVLFYLKGDKTENYRGILQYIVGDIYENEGFFSGALIDCVGPTAHCEISHIIGSIYNNECGNGCLIYSDGLGILSNITGNIEGNHAHFSGALIHANTIQVQQIDGIIQQNGAEQGSGGLFYATEEIRIFGVQQISSNFAQSNGGVAFSENGSITIENVCSISNNIAESGAGGVAYSSDRISVAFSSFSNNSPDDFLSLINDVSVESFTALSGSASITGSGGNPFAYFAEALSFDGSGTYSYQWSNGDMNSITTRIQSERTEVIIRDDSFCSVSFILNIPAPFVDAGSDRNVCAGDIFMLGGTPTGRGGTESVEGEISFQWSPTDYLMDAADSSSSNPTAYIESETLFTVIVTDRATGESSSDSVSIFPLPLLVDAGADQEICVGDSIMIGGNPTGTADVPIEFAWLPSSNLNDNLIANPIASPIITTTYTIDISSPQCNSLNGEDSMTVTVIQPEIVIAEATPVSGQSNFFICQGDSVILGGTSTVTPGPEIFYFWTPSDGLSSQTVAHPVAMPSITTVYTLVVSSYGGCSMASDSVTITVNTLEANAGPDFYNAGVLGGVPSATGGIPPYEYVWSPSDSITNAGLSNPVATPENSTLYNLLVTDTFGCISSDSVNVISKERSYTGYMTLDITLLSELQTMNEIQFFVATALAGVLDVPRLVISVRTISEVAISFSANVDVYQYGDADGESLVGDLMSEFGCQRDVLPCAVEDGNNLLMDSGFSALEFKAPANSGNPENSLSDNGLDSASFGNGLTFSFEDDDVDIGVTEFYSLFLDDGDDETLSDFINGRDDDEDNIPMPPVDNLPIPLPDHQEEETELSSIYIQVETLHSNSPISSLSIVFLLFAFL